MVHSGLWFASCVMAHEQTGLLQATVGMHGHLKTHSDKAEALSKMEASFQDAIQKVADGKLSASALPAEDVLLGIKATMDEVFAETEKVKNETKDMLTAGVNAINACNSNKDAEFANTESPGIAYFTAQLTALDQSHNDCRGVQVHAQHVAESAYCSWQNKAAAILNSVPSCTIGGVPSDDTCLPNVDTAKPTPEELLAHVNAVKGWYEQGFIDLNSRENMYKGETNGAVKAYEDRDDDCDGRQESFEMKYGQFVVAKDAVCTAHTTCFNREMAAFNGDGDHGYTIYVDGVGGFLGEAKEEEEHIKALCFTAQKVNCYIDVIRHMSKGEAYDLNTCKDLTPGPRCEDLNIFEADGTTRDIPAPQAITDCEETSWYMNSDEDSPITAEFCTTHYMMESWYQNMETPPYCDFDSGFQFLRQQNQYHPKVGNADWERLSNGLTNEDCPAR